MERDNFMSPHKALEYGFDRPRRRAAHARALRGWRGRLTMAQPRCSFCGRTHAEVRQLVASPNGAAHICNDCAERVGDVLEANKQPAVPQLRLPSPRELKGILDQYVIEQDDAKRTLAVAVYNHYRRLQNPDSEIQKSNLLLDRQQRHRQDAAGADACPHPAGSLRHRRRHHPHRGRLRGRRRGEHHPAVVTGGQLRRALGRARHHLHRRDRQDRPEVRGRVDHPRRLRRGRAAGAAQDHRGHRHPRAAAGRTQAPAPGAHPGRYRQRAVHLRRSLRGSRGHPPPARGRLPRGFPDAREPGGRARSRARRRGPSRGPDGVRPHPRADRPPRGHGAPAGPQRRGARRRAHQASQRAGEAVRRALRPRRGRAALHRGRAVRDRAARQGAGHRRARVAFGDGAHVDGADVRGARQRRHRHHARQRRHRCARLGARAGRAAQDRRGAAPGLRAGAVRRVLRRATPRRSGLRPPRGGNAPHPGRSARRPRALRPRRRLRRS